MGGEEHGDTHTHRQTSRIESRERLRQCCDKGYDARLFGNISALYM